MVTNKKLSVCFLKRFWACKHLWQEHFDVAHNTYYALISNELQKKVNIFSEIYEQIFNDLKILGSRKTISDEVWKIPGVKYEFLGVEFGIPPIGPPPGLLDRKLYEREFMKFTIEYLELLKLE